MSPQGTARRLVMEGKFTAMDVYWAYDHPVPDQLCPLRSSSFMDNLSVEDMEKVLIPIVTMLMEPLADDKHLFFDRHGRDRCAVDHFGQRDLNVDLDTRASQSQIGG